MRNASIKFFAILLVVILASMYAVSMMQANIITMSSVAVLRTIERTLQIGAVISAIVLGVGLLSSTSDKIKELSIKQQTRNLDATHKPADVQTLGHLINSYLGKRNTTAFFEESVRAISKQAAVIQNRVDTVNSMVEQRFSNGSIGYDQFIVPVHFLFDNLINLGIDLMRRLDKFDAVHYQRKIDEGASSKGHGSGAVGIEEYQEIMDTYVGLVESVIYSFENAAVKLDKLIIEIGDISSDELVRSTTSLQELDSCIAAMKELETRIVLELTEE